MIDTKVLLPVELDPIAVVLEAAEAYGDEDTFIQEAWQLADRVADDTGMSLEAIFQWYADHPELAIELMNEYLNDYGLPKGKSYRSEELIAGGIYVAVDRALMAAFDHLNANEQLPWQRPGCFYCDAKDSKLKYDRINQLACNACWDEKMDGPWQDQPDGERRE